MYVKKDVFQKHIFFLIKFFDLYVFIWKNPQANHWKPAHRSRVLPK